MRANVGGYSVSMGTYSRVRISSASSHEISPPRATTRRRCMRGSPRDFLCGQRDMTCPGGAGRGRRGRRDWRNDGRDNRHLENLLRFAVVLPVPGGVRWTPATPRLTRFRGSSNLLTAFARGRNLIQSPRLFRFSSGILVSLSLCLYGEKTNSQLWIYKVIRCKTWVRIVPFWLDLEWATV